MQMSLCTTPVASGTRWEIDIGCFLTETDCQWRCPDCLLLHNFRSVMDNLAIDCTCLSQLAAYVPARAACSAEETHMHVCRL